MKKTFDCGAEEIYKQIAGMTAEQELAFWRQRTDALKRKQRAVRNRRGVSK